MGGGPSATKAPVVKTNPIKGTTRTPAVKNGSIKAYYAAQDDTEDYNRYPNAIISDAESLDEFLFNAGTKVYGGMDSIRGEIPHQVSLKMGHKRNAHFCGASVIHSVLLLTAAHCITDLNLTADQITVVAGEYMLDLTEEGEQVRNVSRIILHEGWIPTSTTYDNDIAILVLNEPLKFDKYTRSIEIAKGGEILGEKANVSGWGYTREARWPTASYIHQVAEIPFKSRKTCRRYYPGRITENMLCAGGSKLDFCKGDSGGPLTCQKVSSKKNYLCGIVSWGYHKCVATGWPGVYTDVSKYYQWIRKYMGIYQPRVQIPAIMEDKSEDSRISEMGNPWPHDKMVMSNASYGEFPHFATVRRSLGSMTHACGGAIIHPLLVVTSALCPSEFRRGEVTVRTGAYNLRTLNYTSQVRKVRDMIVHERFNNQTWDNNIALLVLEEPLAFDDYTRPIEIPKGNQSRKQGALLSAWRSPLMFYNGTREHVLQRIPANAVDRQNCGLQWANTGKVAVTGNMLCAKVNQSYCIRLGDPLVCESSNGPYRHLCGIASFGRGCIEHPPYGPPGVYTDVSRYYQWITNYMEAVWEQYQAIILGGKIERSEDCGQAKFRCPNSRICIPEDFHCDGEYDCDPLVDWDERNCTISQQVAGEGADR